MDKKRGRGNVEDPGTSNNRRLNKKCNYRLGEANIAPSKMLKVTSGSDDDALPSKFMDEQRDYERLFFLQNQHENELSNNGENEGEDYGEEDESEDEDYDEEDESEDSSGYEDDEEELEDDLGHANNFNEINMPGKKGI